MPILCFIPKQNLKVHPSTLSQVQFTALLHRLIFQIPGSRPRRLEQWFLLPEELLWLQGGVLGSGPASHWHSVPSSMPSTMCAPVSWRWSLSVCYGSGFSSGSAQGLLPRATPKFSAQGVHLVSGLKPGAPACRFNRELSPWPQVKGWT